MSGKVISIAIGNIVSKGIGVVREVLFANWFGTGDTAAAFRIAQTGFLMPTHTLIGDTLSAGLLPLYQKMRKEGGDGHRVLLLAAMLYGVLFSAVTTTAILLYAELIAHFIAPGASSAALELATSLLRILALATPFYVFSGMLSYLETAYGQYNAIAWRPSLLNIGSTAGVVMAAALGQLHWLATCLLLAHIAFFAWSLVSLVRLDRMVPDQMPPWKEVLGVCGQLLRNTAPLLGLPLIAQANILVERIASSWIGTSVIPSVDYARLVNDTAVQLIAVPLSVLTMSRFGGSKPEEVRSHVIHTASIIMILAVPPGIFTATHAASITRLLFARGAFDEHSVAVTSGILTWMSGSLAASVLGYYLVKVLNAQLRNVEALWCVLAGSIVNIAVNLAFWRMFGPATIGIGTAAGSGVVLLIALQRLKLVTKLLPLMGWLALGSALMTAGGEIIKHFLDYPLDLAAATAFAGVVWLVFAAAVPSLRQLVFIPAYNTVRRRL